MGVLAESTFVAVQGKTLVKGFYYKTVDDDREHHRELWSYGSIGLLYEYCPAGEQGLAERFLYIMPCHCLPLVLPAMDPRKDPYVQGLGLATVEEYDSPENADVQAWPLVRPLAEEVAPRV